MLPVFILWSYVSWCIFVTCEFGSPKSHWLWHHSQQTFESWYLPLSGTLWKLFYGIYIQIYWNLRRFRHNTRNLICSVKKTTDQSEFLQRCPKFSKKYTVSRCPHTLMTYSQNSCLVPTRNTVVNQPSCAWWKAGSLQLIQKNWLELLQLI